jgi:hypothetical protein
VADAADCAELDAGVWAVPGVVAGVSLTKPGGTSVEVSWTSQDAVVGPSTVYDLVTGLVGDLRAVGDYRGASCLQDGQANTPYTDTRPHPATGAAYYYLVRAQNVCGTGSWGDSGEVPDPRDGLEDGSASLPDPDPCP